MKILLITNGAVNQSVGAGSTFLNIIPADIELASIYTRNGFPDERVKAAFRINEKMIFNKLFGKSKCAGTVVSERYGMNNMRHRDDVDEKVVQFAQKKRYTVLFWGQDLIWRINVWKSKELKEFIEEFKPDLIFTFLINNIFLNRIILHVLKISQKPLALYAWDNNYCWNKYRRSPFRWINQYFERIYMRKVVSKAKKLYVISDIQKKDYEQIFHKQCTVLTKGADFLGEAPIKKSYNDPLQIVYTGNIGSNRWKSLAIIAKVLEEINCKGVKAQLRIYTATPMTREMEIALNRNNNSIIMGCVSADKISEIQRSADVLVHVEAMDLKDSFAAFYSFSTKIVDYLTKGICIFAVGNKEVASIDYFIKNDAGLVAGNEEEVRECLTKIITDPQILKEYGEKAYRSGKRNHSRKEIEKILNKDFSGIIAKEKR